MVDQYCVSCHSDKLKTGDLSLEKLDLTDVGTAAETWEKVDGKLRSGMMPPSGAKRPDQQTTEKFAVWLEDALDHAAAAKPDPGRPLLHRLNRTEYANAIRDLLTLEVDATPLLPPDDPSFGFDNVADSLGVSPVLLERYLAAAGKISALAVGDPTTRAELRVFPRASGRSQNQHIEGLPLGTFGGVLAKTTLPLDGEYVLQPKLIQTNLGVMRGLEYRASARNQRRWRTRPPGDVRRLSGLQRRAVESDRGWRSGGRSCGCGCRSRPARTKISVAFIQKSAAEGTLRLQPFIRSSADPIDITGHPHLETFQITGPFDATGPGNTPSRRRIFTCRPNGQPTKRPAPGAS